MKADILKPETRNPKPEIKWSRWEGCYESQWSGLISPGAFAHPAKFSRGLIERIFDHCLARGYLKRGDWVGDPFGGVVTGGIIAAYRGLRWVGVELEPRFVALGQENIELHRSRLARLGCAAPVLVQGDSRRFDEVIQRGTRNAERGGPELGAVVTSPPFSAPGAQPPNMRAHCPVHSKFKNEPDRIAANSDRQLGNIETLKPGTLDGAVTSPPYAAISAGAGGLNTRPARRAGQQCGRKASSASQGANQRYGETAGQIAKLKVDAMVTSPPYAKSLRAQQDGIDWDKAKQNGERGQGHGKGMSCHADYGAQPEQIAALPAGNVDAVVTSPPWVNSMVESGDPKYAHKFRGQDKYGTSPGQIGALKSENAIRNTAPVETYWMAMGAVYGACARALRPGGVMAVVVKDYVAKGRRVALCEDTCRLLGAVGFTVVERVQAMLVSEAVHGDMFAAGGSTTVRKERKSFFRRLAEKKGSPRIDYEEVIFARRNEQ